MGNSKSNFEETIHSYERCHTMDRYEPSVCNNAKWRELDVGEFCSPCYEHRIGRPNRVLCSKPETANEGKELRLQTADKKSVRDIGSQCDPTDLKGNESKLLKDECTQTSKDKCINGNVLNAENHVLVSNIQFHVQNQEANHYIDCDSEDSLSKSGKFDDDEEKKTYRELELNIVELELKIQEIEKKKVEMEREHETSCLKLVNDNRKMNESLSLIQDHVRREKIESEQTKDEVDRALQDRQRLIDEITALTKSFESMIVEKERLQIIMETSLSTFENKLYQKDEEIQNLQETIEHDRNNFEEERGEYLTVIECLKTELLFHENRQIRSI
ncbi:hyaluronan mediated motility receptor-like [Argopecten irradians]|uniref:hyaluronan mediated motility receptor-like n=1 Tax=Argopecten irradians TaxID=31199 RepID=UPI003711E9CC